MLRSVEVVPVVAVAITRAAFGRLVAVDGSAIGQLAAEAVSGVVALAETAPIARVAVAPREAVSTAAPTLSASACHLNHLFGVE